MRQLLLDAKRGGLIIGRDQSRLGRDAHKVPLVIRDLVRDRDIHFANAIDEVTTEPSRHHGERR
ncbi:MAG: hypothetical protein ACKV2T_22535 [Kofleriaceae bacterium]